MTDTQMLLKNLGGHLEGVRYSKESDDAILAMHGKRKALISQAGSNPYRPPHAGIDDTIMDKITEVSWDIAERPAKSRAALLAKLDVVMELVSRIDDGDGSGRILRGLGVDIIAQECAIAGEAHGSTAKPSHSARHAFQFLEDDMNRLFDRAEIVRMTQGAAGGEQLSAHLVAVGDLVDEVAGVKKLWGDFQKAMVDEEGT